MMEETKKLIVSLTQLADQMTVKLARENGFSTTAAPAEPEAPKRRKAAAPKEETAAETIAKLPEMSDAESATEVLAVTRAYVSRFQKQDPDGQKRALKILAEDFKVPGIKALVHSQRLAFIAKLKGEIADADKVPA